ncbi:hypothetical protein CANARDRAFT_28709 [[Candida] arabinofermentans NRRL YB-2248]|uniref:Amino acid permease/ SLC12A domain-containing protein n=1 Tax=[Candida] arabinofermentans NRRL YB-2248 TaxID=983967 RepID=A0A1E4SZQ9_9ASCO|nr:hypothetical protein CANARDRAFT_28709 [[Candida] arabinofermentans NRRL YB-2248]
MTASDLEKGIKGDKRASSTFTLSSTLTSIDEEHFESTNPLTKLSYWIKNQCDSFKQAEGDAKVLHPQLSGFSLQMIAIGGSIGTGLFIGTGEALSQGGAAGLIICYTLTSFMIYFMVQSLAELACTFPVPGAFSYFASTFIDSSVGFAISWNYAMQWLVLLPLELSAATMTFKFWNGFPIGDGYLISGFFIMIIAINMMPVKIYGYAEVVFSLTKVIAIFGFLIIALIVLFGGIEGQDAILDKYWRDPGPFSDSGFKGIVAVFIISAFSFAGTEMCGLCAAETPRPNITIPKASKQVFWRILFFYMSSLILIGLLVPYNEPKLISKRDDTTSNSSPFVIAIQNANIPWLPSIMNVVILISILSVGNSAIYAASRTFVSLAEAGVAPHSLSYIDRNGRPLVAIGITLAFGTLAYVSLISGDAAHVLFTWLLSLSGLSSLFTWSSICFSLIRFRKAMKDQHRSLHELSFISIVGLPGAWFSFIFCIVVLIAQLWIAISPIGSPPSFENFLKVYLGAFVIIFFFVAHKLYLFFTTGSFQFGYKASDIDIISGRREKDIYDSGLVYQQIRDELSARPWYYRTLKVWC